MFLKNVFSPLVVGLLCVAAIEGSVFWCVSRRRTFFVFKEDIMKIRKIVVCLVAVLVLSSCINMNYPDDTTIYDDVITESPTEPRTEPVTEKSEIVHPESKHEENENSFIVNKSTKKYHNEDCRYVGFMNDENKVFVTSTPEKLQSQSYKPCHFCQ